MPQSSSSNSESSLSPAERTMRAKLAAYDSWAQTEDRTARTEPARRAFQERFERQVDPDGVLAPAERAERAESARKAHMLRMALNSARARRLRAEQSFDDEVAKASGIESSGAGDAA